MLGSGAKVLEADNICFIIDPVFVSFTNKNLVQVYNEEGELLHTIGGQFGWPYGLTTTRSGRLIVASNHEDHGLLIL